MLNEIVKIDESIIEKESFQIIIDFKWDSYAWKFFTVQLGLFICFIIAFILDVVAVSKNSHVFSSDDSNQVIPRIISIAILIPFAIYEIANIVITRKTYFQSFWNFIDMLQIALYVAYFTTYIR
jgi:ABC-type methionine transport system permease subunit